MNIVLTYVTLVKPLSKKEGGCNAPDVAPSRSLRFQSGADFPAAQRRVIVARSAELHSAVSRICNYLQSAGLGKVAGSPRIGASADSKSKSAIQQSPTLRYDVCVTAFALRLAVPGLSELPRLSTRCSRATLPRFGTAAP